METKRYADYKLSRLMLGTVQFGLPYGVANLAGQPGYDDVLAIVSAAIEGGVNCFDTAPSYGRSEEVLGRALHELGVVDRVVVVTKVKALTQDELADPRLVGVAIEQSVAESRRRLRVECLPIVLFHHETDAVHLDALERLKEKGWLRHVGVSCNNRPGPAAGFAALPVVRALQIPANILDRRHLQGGSLAAAAAHGVAVFVRSVYLQGLLLMPERAIPEPLRPIVPIRRRLAELAEAAGMTLAELALRYMLAQDGVTSVLTGVETVEQMRENVALFNRGPLSGDVREAVEAIVPDLPEAIMTPGLWSAPATEKDIGNR